MEPKKTTSDPWMLQAACDLARKGVSVHWLLPRQKRPAFEEWSTAPIASAQDLKKSYVEGYNLGVRPGEYSKIGDLYLHLIDLDVRDEERESEAWVALSEVLPEAHTYPTVISGSGGSSRHIYFFCKEPLRSRKLASGPDWSVTLYGSGLQAVLPPSIHPVTGKEYRWLRPIDWDSLSMGLGPIVSTKDLAKANVKPSRVETADSLQDLAGLAHKRPLGLTEEEVNSTLEALPLTEWCDSRDGWLKVGMALHHEYEGAQEGYEKWCAFSQQSAKFDEEDQARVWMSFYGRTGEPVRMATLIRAAKEAEGFAPDILEALGTPSKPEGFTLKPWSRRNFDLIPPRDWLFGTSYIRKYVSVTVAPGGTGKTALTIVEALSMASGLPLLPDETPVKPLRVALINLEDPMEELELRFAAAERFFELEECEELSQNIFVSGRETPLVIATEDRGDIKVVEPVVDRIMDEIKKNQIDVVIIDPFISSHRVSENDNNKIDVVAKTWGRVAEEANCAIQLVHHVRKSTNSTQNGTLTTDDARGAASLVNASRMARVLNRMSEAECEELDIEKKTRWRYFRVDDGKTNLAPPAEFAKWRKLESVVQAPRFDAPDLHRESVGVVSAWTPPEREVFITPSETEAFLNAVRGGDWREDYRAKNWVGLALAETLSLNPKDEDARKDIKKVLKDMFAEGTLSVAESKDDQRKLKRFVVVGLSAPGSTDFVDAVEDDLLG